MGRAFRRHRRLARAFRVWRCAWRLAVGGVAVATVACDDSATGPRNESARHPVDLAPEWTLTSPSAEGIDSAALAAVLDGGAGMAGLTSLVVVRHSHLVGERYFARGGRDSLYSLRSVTKSVMSLLVGAAIDRHLITGTGETLAAFVGPPLPPLDSAKGAITIADLLTMSSGFQWGEDTSVAQYDAWVTSPNEVTYLVDRPLVTRPGTVFSYNSAAVHLLSVILTHVDPAGTPAFADSVLFTPIGIHSSDWEIFPDGIANGGAGLYLRPRDMAKIGALVLQQGRSGSRTVISSAWIRTSTQFHIESEDGLFPVGAGRLGYADLWWLGRAGGRSCIFAWGYGGQYILIIPDLDLVVVATATWQGVGTAAYSDAITIMSFIANGVLPAVHAGA
jgi:CubicO group peptidase (beta-lactamase class C family)